MADQPDYATVKARMIKALEQWRNETEDPLLDEGNLKRFTREHDTLRVNDPEMKYRKDRDFQWDYLEYFRE